VVAVRARATEDAPSGPDTLPVVDRAPVQGPAVVAETDCTMWVPDGWHARVGPLGAWLLTRLGSA
jgi:hypothetical protein